MIWFANFQKTLINNEALIYCGYVENINNQGFYFKNIEHLFERIIKKSEPKDTKHTIYFENLTYDGEFILWWLIKNNLTPISSGKVENNTFKEKNDHVGKKIEMYFIYKNIRFDLLCSKKIFNFVKEEIGDLLNLEQFGKNNICKIDFNKEVPDYIKDFSFRKVQELKKHYMNFTKNYKVSKTASSTAWTNFKNWYFKEYGFKDWTKRYYWTTDLFDEFQEFYFGGLCLLNSKYKNIEINNDILKIDKNSCYASILLNELLPFGKPKFEKPNEPHLTFIKAKIYDIKKKDLKMPDHLHNKAICSDFPNTYLTNFKDILCVGYTSFEWEEIKKTYDFKIFDYKEIYFLADKKLGGFIKMINDQKEKTTDPEEIFNHKLIMNSLTGKFGQHYQKLQKHLIESKNNNKYSKYNYEFKEHLDFEIKYNPVAIFINSYARTYLLKLIRQLGDDFISCDTDSIITFRNVLNEKKINIKLSKKIGDWKIEKEIVKIKFMSSKFYIYENLNGKIEQKLSGIHKSKHFLYNFDNFKAGNVIKNGNIKIERINGGLIFKEQDIKIGNFNIEKCKKITKNGDKEAKNE